LERTYVSPQQFSELTGHSLQTVYRRLWDGSLPAIQSGGKRKSWRIDWTAYQERTRAPQSPIRGDVAIATAVGAESGVDAITSLPHGAVLDTPNGSSTKRAVSSPKWQRRLACR